MFEVLPESTDECFGFKVSGKLTAEDYAELLPKIDEAIAANEQINMLVLIDHLEGWEGKEAAKADYEFGRQQYRHVARCAFVSDKKWHRWVIKLMDPFTRRTDEKFFEPAELDQAWAWARGESS
jgi:hypothetical protein